MLPQYTFHTKFYALENLPQLVSFVQQQTCQLLGWQDHYQEILKHTHYASTQVFNTHFPYAQRQANHTIAANVTMCDSTGQVFKYAADQLLRSAGKSIANFVKKESIDNPNLITKNPHGHLFVSLDACKLPLTADIIRKNINVNVFANSLEYLEEQSSDSSVKQVFSSLNSINTEVLVNVWSLQQFLAQTTSQLKLALLQLVQTTVVSLGTEITLDSIAQASSKMGENSTQLTGNNLDPEYDYALSQIQQGFIGTSLLNPAFYHRLTKPNTPFSQGLATETANSLNSYFDNSWFNEVNPRFTQILPRNFDFRYSEQEQELITTFVTQIREYMGQLKQDYIDTLTNLYQAQFLNHATVLYDYYQHDGFKQLTGEQDLLTGLDLPNTIDGYANQDLVVHLNNLAQLLGNSDALGSKPSDLVQLGMNSLTTTLLQDPGLKLELITYVTNLDLESITDLDLSNVNNGSHTVTINAAHLDLITTKLASYSLSQVFGEKLEPMLKVMLHFYTYYLATTNHVANHQLDIDLTRFCTVATATATASGTLPVANSYQQLSHYEQSSNSLTLVANPDLATTHRALLDESIVLYLFNHKLSLTCHHFYRLAHKQVQFLCSPYQTEYLEIMDYSMIVDGDVLLAKNWLVQVLALLEQNKLRHSRVYKIINLNTALSSFNSDLVIDRKLPQSLVHDLALETKDLHADKTSLVSPPANQFTKIQSYLHLFHHNNYGLTTNNSIRSDSLSTAPASTEPVSSLSIADRDASGHGLNSNLSQSYPHLRLINPYLVLSPLLAPINLNHYHTALNFQQEFITDSNLALRLLTSKSHLISNQDNYCYFNIYHNQYGTNRDLSLSDNDFSDLILSLAQQDQCHPIYYRMTTNSFNLSSKYDVFNTHEFKALVLEQKLDPTTLFTSNFVDNTVEENFKIWEQTTQKQQDYTSCHHQELVKYQAIGENLGFNQLSSLDYNLNAATNSSFGLEVNSSTLLSQVPSLRGFNLNSSLLVYRLSAYNPLSLTIADLSGLVQSKTVPSGAVQTQHLNLSYTNLGLPQWGLVKALVQASQGSLATLPSDNDKINHLDQVLSPVVTTSRNTARPTTSLPTTTYPLTFLNFISSYEVVPTASAYLFNSYITETIHNCTNTGFTMTDFLDYYNKQLVSQPEFDPFTNPQLKVTLTPVEILVLQRSLLGSSISNHVQSDLVISSDHGSIDLIASGHFYPSLAQCNSYQRNYSPSVFYCLTTDHTNSYALNNVIALKTQLQQLQQLSHLVKSFNCDQYLPYSYDYFATRLGPRTKALSPLLAYNLLAVKDIFRQVCADPNINLNQMVTIIPSSYKLYSSFSHLVHAINQDTTNELVIYDPIDANAYFYGLTSYQNEELIPAKTLYSVNVNINKTSINSNSINGSNINGNNINDNSINTSNSNANLNPNTSPLCPSFTQAQTKRHNCPCPLTLQLNLLHNPFVVISLGGSFVLNVYQVISQPRVEISNDSLNLLKSYNFNKSYNWHHRDNLNNSANVMHSDSIISLLTPLLLQPLCLQQLAPNLQTKFTTELMIDKLWLHWNSELVARAFAQQIKQHQQSELFLSYPHLFNSLAMVYSMGQVVLVHVQQDPQFYQWQLRNFGHLKVEHKYPITLYTTVNNWNKVLYCLHANVSIHDLTTSVLGHAVTPIHLQLRTYLDKIYFSAHDHKATLSHLSVSPHKLISYLLNTKCFNTFNLSCFSISKRLILETKALWEHPDFMVKDLITYLALVNDNSHSDLDLAKLLPLNLDLPSTVVTTKISLPTIDLCCDLDHNMKYALYSANSISETTNLYSSSLSMPATSPMSATALIQPTLHVRYLNLEIQPERKAHMDKFLTQAQVAAKALGWNLAFKRQPAVLGRELTSKQLQQLCDLRQASRQYNRFMTDGEIGVSLATLNNFRDIAQDSSIEDTDYVLCLEDDITTTSDWVHTVQKVLHHIQSTPCQHPPRLLNLGHYCVRENSYFGYYRFKTISFPKYGFAQSQLPFNAIGHIHAPIFNSAGGFAYLVRKDLVKQIISKIEADQIKLSWLADDFLQYPTVTNRDLALINPTVFFVNNINTQTNISSNRASLITFTMYLY